jgi:hypothetical protein
VNQNPDLPRLLAALAAAPVYQSHHAILVAAMRELLEWRALPADSQVVELQMFDGNGVPAGKMHIPADVLRSAYRVHDWLREHDYAAASLCGLSIREER